MICAALAMSLALSCGPRVYVEPEEMIVSDVDCDQWERVDANTWRAEGGALVLTEDGQFVSLGKPVDATLGKAADLFWTLEYFCRSEMDGGIE